MSSRIQRMTAVAAAFLVAGVVTAVEPTSGGDTGRPGPNAAGQPAEESAAAILGTWTNKEYNDEGRSGRVVYTKHADGRIHYVATDRADGSGINYPGTVVFHKQWTDDEGRLCAVSTVTLDQGFAWKTLSRISADRKTLEVQSGVEKINPKGPRYSIYHKQAPRQPK